MSKLKSQSFPGSNIIPVGGGRLNVYSDLISIDMDDNFEGGRDPALWTSFIYGTPDYTEVSEPTFHINMGAPSNFALLSQSVINNGSVNITFKSRVYFDPAMSTLPKVEIGIGIVSPDVSTGVNFIHSHDYDLGVVKLAGSAISDIPLTDDGYTELDLNLVIDSLHGQKRISIIRNGVILSTSDYTFVDPIVKFALFVNVYQAPVTVYFSSFHSHPSFSGIQQVDYRPIVPDSVRSGFASMSVSPAYPGVFQLSTGGSGSTASESSVIAPVQVIDAETGEDAMRFLISPVEKLYTDAAPILACRNRGISSPSNVGPVTANMRCVCDGSEEDDSVALVQTVKGGSLEAEKIEDLPRFQIVSKDGKEYGCSQELLRLHQETIFNSLSSESGSYIKELRTINLSNGDRLYYGTKTTPIVTQKWKPIFNNPIGEVILYKAWKLFKLGENTRVEIGGAEALYPATMSAPATFSLAEGFYCYKFIGGTGAMRVLNDAETEEDDFLKIDKFSTLPGTSTIWQEDLAYSIYFEVKNFNSSLFAYRYKRCTGELVKYEPDTTLVSNKRVSNLSDSFSAVELEDGRILFVYDESNLSPSPGFHRHLTYRILNTNTGVFSDSAKFVLPSGIFDISAIDGNKYIYAFDLVKTGDVANLIVSLESKADFFDMRLDRHSEEFTYSDDPTIKFPTGSVQTRRTRSAVPFRPFLDSGFRCIEILLSDYDFAGSDEYIVDYEDYLRRSVSVERMFKNIDYDYSYNQQGDPVVETLFIRCGSAFIRGSYDELSDSITLATLDVKRRVPFIYFGKSNDWQDVCIPFHFKAYDMHLNPDIVEYFSGIKSFGSCIGFDGRFYSLAVNSESTLDRAVELGVVSPSILSSSTEYFVDRIDRRGRSEVSTNFIKFYEEGDKQLFHPLLARVSETSTGRITGASLHRDNQYLVASYGNTKSLRPMVYQSFNHDQVPFSRMNDWTWIPEFGGSTSWTKSSLVTYDDQYVDMGIDGNFSNILTTLGLASGGEGRKGYKFYLRALTSTSDMLSENLISMVADVKLGSKSAKAGIRRNAASVEFFVVNHLNVEQVVHSFEYTHQHMLDYYILVQLHQENHYRVAFVVKDFKHNTIGSNRYNFINDTFSYVHYGEITRGSTDESIVISSSDTLNVGEVSRVYEASVASLTPLGGYGNRGNNASPPGTWGSPQFLTRTDYWVFNDIDSPGHLYPMRNGINSNRSQWMHYPNGFEFNFSDLSSVKDDEIEISRERIDDVNFIQSNRLHGVWRSFSDNTDVTIWADAFDSGLDRFFVDCYLVEGSNFPDVILVGKDSLEDPWIEIDSMSLRRFNFSGLSYVQHEDSTELKSDYDFNIGKFNWREYYFNSLNELDGLGFPIEYNASKVLKSDEDKIWTTKSMGRSSSEGGIFSSKGSRILDTMVQYRFIGIKIPSYKTHEGYFTLENFDFGKARELPLKYNYDIGSGGKFESECNVYFVDDEQAFTRNKKKMFRMFDLSYSVMDGALFMKIISAMEMITLKRKPIWILEEHKVDRDKFSLCLSESDVETRVLVDEDNEKYYELNMAFKSIKGE